MLKSVNPLQQEISLHISSVETAQREYDVICAQCPATHEEAFLDPGKYRLRMKWIDQKFHAEKRLDMAKAFAASGWKSNGAPVEVKIQPVKHHQARKPIPELIACYLDKIAILLRVEPRSPKYVSARNQAYGYKYLILERCKEEHMDLPNLPPVPALPPLAGPRKSPPLKPLTGDPAVDERRRRDRERRRLQAAEGKVVNG